jgi:uncharacterized protein (TIGR00725 family)
MARKPVVAVIGGNDLPDVAPSASLFGAALSNGAILLTGGEPTGPSADVKNAAMQGCNDAKGLMISVLPQGPPSCCLLVSERRLVLKTGLKPLERDPITGAAADVVVAFSGGRGTLVELAYAAFEHRPIVFVSSLVRLQGAYREKKEKLEADLATASGGYRLIDVGANQLMTALEQCLNGPNRCFDSPAAAAEEMPALIEGIDCERSTNFRGLPGTDDDVRKFVRIFEDGVVSLSLLA